MAVKRVMLHAGAFKTGTTTLQVIANRNRHLLAEAGILWPQAGLRSNLGARSDDSKAHHLIYHMTAEKSGDRAEDLPVAQEIRKEFLETGCETALVSTELLSSTRAVTTFERFLTVLGWPEIDVAVDYAIRLPDEYVESRRAQSLKGKGRCGDSKSTPFRRVVTRFAELLGRENVRVRYFRKQNAPQLFREFFADLGAGSLIDPGDFMIRENEPLSVEGLAIRKYVFSRYNPTGHQRRKFLMRRLAEIEDGLPERHRLVVLSPDERAGIRAHNLDDMRAVAAYLTPEDRELLLQELAQPVSPATPNAEIGRAHV